MDGKHSALAQVLFHRMGWAEEFLRRINIIFNVVFFNSKGNEDSFSSSSSSYSLVHPLLLLLLLFLLLLLDLGLLLIVVFISSWLEWYREGKDMECFDWALWVSNVRKGLGLV